MRRRSRRDARGVEPTGRPTPEYESRLQRLGEEIDRRDGSRRRRRSSRQRVPWSRRRKVLTVLCVLAALLVALLGGSYGYLRYRFDALPKLHVSGLVPSSGSTFNMLVIGSDSRLGLTPAEQKAAGSAAQVSGQRSDVVMIWHVDPATHAIAVLSIPRDTMVQMDGDQSLFGQFNRINASFNSGANLLVKTIEDNFGIPINHVIEVDFGGFEGAVNALGGIYLDFPYAAKDAYSGLDVTHTGCQLLDGAQALAVARSRHYQYEVDGQWLYDGTSDFGRIDRQDAFLRALIDAAKSKLNPLTLNAFIGSLPQGLEIDDGFSAGQLLRLALSFHSFPASALQTYTLPTVSDGDVSPWGDVLFVDQPSAQQMLTAIFGSELDDPTTPPPNTALVPTPPPSLSTQLIPSGPTTSAAVLTSTVAPNSPPSFDPTPCTP